MNANRLILVAAALALVACSDNYQPSLTDPTGSTTPPVPVLQRLRGTVVLDEQYGAPSLQTDMGRINMNGAPASAMASVEGAHVIVVGTLDDTMGLTVESFEVIAIHGQAALDGHVDMDDQGNLSILLPNDELVLVDNPPEGLREYIGRRIWLIQGGGEVPTEFGPITVPGLTV